MGARRVGAGSTGAAPIVEAKLTPPRSAQVWIDREHLLDRLRGNAATLLTAVIAPVGWGKTTLLSHWATDDHEPRPVTWFTADADDDEPVRFWTYAVTALRRATPGLGEGVLGALQMPGADLVGVVLPELLNELAHREREHPDAQAVLVVDDYHRLRDRELHESVEFLLAYLPRSLHLAVASREDPPLPLARLRARGQLTEIRAADLRFAERDAAALLQATVGHPVGEGTVAAVTARTEGWAAGLYLAGLRARGEPDPATTLASLRGDDSHLRDYLATELLDRLPDGAEAALVRLSVAERVCAPLADAVLETGDAHRLLADLNRRSALLTDLGGEPRWFRLHQLLRDVLAARLRERDSPEEVAALHRRASAWFADHGDEERAIRHLLSAGDHAAAAERLLHASPTDWFGGPGALETFARLGAALPGLLLDADPRIAVQLAFVHGLCGRHDVARHLAQRAGRVLEESAADPPLPGWCSTRAAVAAAQAAYAYSDDPETLVAWGARAVELEQDRTIEGYAVARMALAVGLLAGDRPAEAAEILTAVRREAWAPVGPVTRLIASGLHAQACLRSGDEEGARRVVEDAWPTLVALEQRVGDSAAAATTTLHTVAGELARRRGALAEALSELERSAELARSAPLPAMAVSAHLALAGARLAAGDQPGARAAVVQAREVADEEPLVASVRARLEGLEARVGRGAARDARRDGVLQEDLTDREHSLLRVLQGPLTLREIAGELYLSHNTVKGYAKSLYRKLGVASRSEAVREGRRLGLI